MDKTAIETAYIRAYNAAMAALQDIENMIHDNPAPEGETEIDWGHVGNMNRITANLKEILSTK